MRDLAPHAGGGRVESAQGVEIRGHPAIANTGGGTKYGSTVLFTCLPSWPCTASHTYTITVTASRNNNTAIVGAATVSITRDPNYRNNFTSNLIRIT